MPNNKIVSENLSNMSSMDDTTNNQSSSQKHQWTGEVAPLYPNALRKIKGLGAIFSELSKHKSTVLKIVGIVALLSVALLIYLSQTVSFFILILLIFFGGPMLVFFTLFLMVLSMILYYGLVTKGSNEDIFADFAEANNLTYRSKIEGSQLASSLTHQSRSGWIEDEFSGNFGGLPFRIFMYSYHRRTNDGSTMTVRRYVMEVTLPRKMPHLVVDSLVESEGVLRASALPIEFDSSLRMQLEGDFYKSFDVYTWDRDAVTNLAILTPDTMVMLMDHAIKYDMEIVQDKFYLYTSSVSSAKETIPDMHATAARIFSKIGRQLTTANILEKSSKQTAPSQATDSPDPKQSSAAHHTEKSTYQRLSRSKGNPFILALSFIVAASVILYFFNTFFSNVNQSFFITAIVVIGIINVITYYFQSRQ